MLNLEGATRNSLGEIQVPSHGLYQGPSDAPSQDTDPTVPRESLVFTHRQQFLCCPVSPPRTSQDLEGTSSGHI